MPVSCLDVIHQGDNVLDWGLPPPSQPLSGVCDLNIAAYLEVITPEALVKLHDRRVSSKATVPFLPNLRHALHRG
jgi:hypothetical protein